MDTEARLEPAKGWLKFSIINLSSHSDVNTGWTCINTLVVGIARSAGRGYGPTGAACGGGRRPA